MTGAATPEPEDRRTFLARLAGGVAALATLLASWPLVRSLLPNVLYEPPASFKAGAPDEYSVGVDERWKARFGVWIVRDSTGFTAIKSVCTHLGCTPNWLSAEEKFKCPCHGSGFYATGINFEGPAPRPLERYRIYLADDGQLVVDRSRIFQQEKGQWTDPDASFSYTA